MGCDMMVALGPATVQGHALIGLNVFDHARRTLRLRHFAAANHSPDEMIQTRLLEIPQARTTCAVLGAQLDDADWGLSYGCNEHQLAVGVTRWRSRLPATKPGLAGTELVRLALERSHSTRHAVEVLTDLISRHGQCDPDSKSPDSVFLIADAHEASVLEVAGTHWALLECPQTRAVSDEGLIRQDWRRLAPGLAEQAIHKGWWQDDGTKLDFVGCLGRHDAADTASLKRWSKATLALAQQDGALDPYVLRRLLAEHYDACLRGSAACPDQPRWLGTIVTHLDSTGTPLVWFAGGSAAAPLYFPLVAGVELPVAWITNPPFADVAETVVERLQGQFDQDAEEFLNEARILRQRGETATLRRLAQAMMHRHAEQWAAVTGPRVEQPSNPVTIANEDAAAYAFG